MSGLEDNDLEAVVRRAAGNMTGLGVLLAFGGCATCCFLGAAIFLRMGFVPWGAFAALGGAMSATALGILMVVTGLHMRRRSLGAAQRSLLLAQIVGAGAFAVILLVLGNGVVNAGATRGVAVGAGLAALAAFATAGALFWIELRRAARAIRLLDGGTTGGFEVITRPNGTKRQRVQGPTGDQRD